PVSAPGGSRSEAPAAVDAAAAASAASGAAGGEWRRDAVARHFRSEELQRVQQQLQGGQHQQRRQPPLRLALRRLGAPELGSPGPRGRAGAAARRRELRRGRRTGAGGAARPRQGPEGGRPGAWPRGSGTRSRQRQAAGGAGAAERAQARQALSGSSAQAAQTQAQRPGGPPQHQLCCKRAPYRRLGIARTWAVPIALVPPGASGAERGLRSLLSVPSGSTSTARWATRMLPTRSVQLGLAVLCCRTPLVPPPLSLSLSLSRALSLSL
ncbi:unnamed protein product, partial [Prorocentrum cordatum]